MSEGTETHPQNLDPTQDNATPVPEAAAVEAPAEAAPEGGDRVAELEAELAKLKNEVLYARAETENTRRRLEQQAEDRAKYAIGNFAKEMVTVADNLRRALDSIPADQRQGNELADTLMVGVEMTERTLISAMERFGVKPIAALGARFDPNLHQAMMEMEDPSKPAGTVVMVMQTGYTLHDRLLRPAMVGVSKGGPKVAPGEQMPPAEGEGRVDTTV